MSSEKQKQEEVTFNLEGLEEQILAHIKQNGGKASVLGPAFAQEVIRRTYQALLDAEMEEHLGYSKHSKTGKTQENRRNGRGRKKIRGDFGEVEINPPRDRDGSFSPIAIKKREASVGNFTEKIISLYARGLTTREIEEHLREMYGIEASESLISRATDAVKREVTEWQNRPLERVYVVLYVDGIRFNVRVPGEHQIRKKVVYTVLGINTEGLQEVLGLWISDAEGAHFWLKVFNDLHARGVEDILIACGDGLKGLPEAIEEVFPKAEVQLCIVHQIRNATKFVSWKDRKQFCADMKLIYGAPTEEAACAALDELEAKWGDRYPASIDSWRRNWERLVTFLRYPLELRKVVYTTNSIEGLHALFRKNTSNRKVFPNDDALMKLLYLNIQNFTKKWRKRQGWGKLMNQISILFPNRLEPSELGPFTGE